MPNARNTDPETSHEAADSVDKIRQRQAEVETLLRIYGPLTDNEIAVAHELQSVAARKAGKPLLPQAESGLRTRRSELVAHGRVVRRDFVLNERGRRVSVWAVVDQGFGLTERQIIARGELDRAIERQDEHESETRDEIERLKDLAREAQREAHNARTDLENIRGLNDSYAAKIREYEKLESVVAHQRVQLSGIQAHTAKWLEEPRRSIYSRTKDVVHLVQALHRMAATRS